MKLSLTAWSFPACSLRECADISRALGIGALDVGLFYASALPRADLLADPEAVAAVVRDLGVRVPNYYHLFGAGLEDRNLADPASLAANLRDLTSVLRFADAAGIATVFVLPGVINPGQSRVQAQDASAAALAEMLAVAADHAATLTIEAHVHSILECPADALRMVERVAGLKLTLDYAHFACLGYRQDEIDPLAPHAAHVHLRQARPGALQAKGGEGTLNMEAQFGALRDAGFTGHMALEYVHQDYMGTLHDDVLTETVRLRDRWRRWSGEGT